MAWYNHGQGPRQHHDFNQITGRGPCPWHPAVREGEPPGEPRLSGSFALPPDRSTKLSISANQRRTTVVFAAVIVIAGAGGSLWWRASAFPKRFGVVKPGRLYRCGEITPRRLERVANEHGIRTVLSLLNPNVPESIAERQAAEQLGLRWINVPLPGDGASTPEERDRIKAVLFDPAAAPLLVHCAAGANRTGLAIGMYRIHQDGWSVEQVLAEMRAYDFEDLPKHENLRQALSTEWRSARSATPPAVPAAKP